MLLPVVGGQCPVTPPWPVLTLSSGLAGAATAGPEPGLASDISQWPPSPGDTRVHETLSIPSRETGLQWGSSISRQHDDALAGRAVRAGAGRDGARLRQPPRQGDQGGPARVWRASALQRHGAAGGHRLPPLQDIQCREYVSVIPTLWEYCTFHQSE